MNTERRFPLAVALVALALVGCGILEPTYERINERPLTPLAIYPVWYEETRACVGVHHDQPFESIKWSQVDEFGLGGGTDEVAGVWNNGHIIIRSDHLEDERVVKHEMIHHFIATVGHAPIFDRCS